MSEHPAERRLLRPIDPHRDHIRGGGVQAGRVSVLTYGDFLCPYCRRLGQVFTRLRRALGERMLYVFRHFPNERPHPGSELASIAAEAAGAQGRFWEMHDALFAREPPIDRQHILEIARLLALDMTRFERDLNDPKLRQRVQEDLADGRRNGVTATPTIFVDGMRYDGAWDFYSMIEVLEPPIGAQVQRTARAFANLPTSGALTLLLATALAILCANSPLRSLYERLVNAQIGIGPSSGGLALSVAQWSSEGLLAVFYVILGLDIRREMTAGSLSEWRASIAPLFAGISGIAVPAALYLALDPGATAAGWSVPADTGVAFTLGVLALFGVRASSGLKAFVSTYAISNDISSTLVLAASYPHTISPRWFMVGFGIIGLMALFARWRVYALWPYLAAVFGLWLSLHLAGVSGALSGIALAAFIPVRPAPSAAPLLAQAASALAELEYAEHELSSRGDRRGVLEQGPIWDWAARNLRAAANRFLSPADRVERATDPWSTYCVLPIFAFTAAGISLSANFGAYDASRVFLGELLAVAVAKPIAIMLTTWIAWKVKVGLFPSDTTPRAFFGAAFLCGIADPFSFYMADQAFLGTPYASVAKLGALVGSLLAALVGVIALAGSPVPATDARAPLPREGGA